MNRVYDKWGGNPKGTPEDTTRCIKGVSDGRFHSYQCSRRRGHGPDGLYCKQHAKKIHGRLTLANGSSIEVIPGGETFSSGSVNLIMTDDDTEAPK